MAPWITNDQRRARLARRHLLLPDGRTDDVVAVADAVVALHSSDPASVYLSAWARMRHPSLAAVERVLYDPPALVRHHAMRRTLWVMSPQVARLAHAACTTGLVKAQTTRTVGMIEQAGISENGAAWLEQAKRKVLHALHSRGRASTRQLGADVPELTEKLLLAPDTRYAASPSAHTRVLLLLGFDGDIVRVRPSGSWINGAYTWAAMDEVLPGGIGGLDAAPARAELVRRWLRAFGPGTAADLQWWLGSTAAAVKRALETVEAVPVRLDSGPGWILPDDTDPVAEPEPWVALLPGLDPTVMGWQQRDFYLDPALGPHLFDRNGNAGPTIWANGRVVGGWVQRPDGEITIKLLTRVSADLRRRVLAVADELRDVLGDDRFTVRFPSPVSTALRSSP